jgi:hypothetical protein
MWGVLIFLRFYYIVGNAGIWQVRMGIIFVSAWYQVVSFIVLFKAFTPRVRLKSWARVSGSSSNHWSLVFQKLSITSVETG